MMCNKCKRMGGWVALVVGVLFLLRDFGVWNFWNIQGWTVLFLIVGLVKVGSCGCDECKTMMKTKK